MFSYVIILLVYTLFKRHWYLLVALDVSTNQGSASSPVSRLPMRLIVLDALF